MLNRPFSSINTNIFDEKTQNSIPATICGQNVFLSQEQHQKIFNTSTTSIAGMPGHTGHYPPIPIQQTYPNCITFTFGPTQTSLPPQQYCQCYPALQNLNQLQQSNAIDLMTLQRQLNEPYTCKFHLDNQTSTSDLTKGSVVRPDLSNLAGILKSKWPYWLQAPMTRNHKKLILRNVTAKLEGNVFDDLDKENTQKKVSFELNTTKDVDCQVQLCCTCCQNATDDSTQVTKIPRTRKKSRKKNTKPIDRSSTDDDDLDDDKR